ncbi:MAG: amidohydrolase family protein [Thaumarchaeota archaeon]|nr:amidohydrolase family protein [Nitrososphaerota archaeon]
MAKETASPEFSGIVDAHAHSDRKFSWEHTPEQVVAMMEECGIVQSVLTSYWDLPSDADPEALPRFRSILRKCKGKFLGFLRANPNSAGAQELLTDLAKSKEIKGLKLNPMTTSVLPFSEKMIQIVKLASELGLPTLFHSGDDPFSNPLQIEKVARLCPAATIILGHMGGFFYVDEAIRVVKRNSNVFLETSVMPYPSLIRIACKTLGPQKIFFGSDSPGVHPRIEIQKIISSGLNSEDQSEILTSSFLRLLN